MTIVLFHAIMLVLLPTVPTYLILRDRLRIPWLLFATPLPAALLAGVTVTTVTTMQSMAGGPPPPEGKGFIAEVMLAAWVLAFVITVAMFAATAVTTRMAGKKQPRP